jgi:diaminopimelate decarboxylase
MTGDTQLLLGRVHALKAAEDRTYAVLDAGINHAECVRNEYHQLLHVDRPEAGASRLYTVVGPICTPGDTLYPAKRLPELAVGDTLAIMDAGAYFVPFATSFSYPQPAIISLDGGGREQLLRRAETFDDLVTFDAPPAEPVRLSG